MISHNQQEPENPSQRKLRAQTENERQLFYAGRRLATVDSHSLSFLRFIAATSLQESLLPLFQRESINSISSGLWYGSQTIAPLSGSKELPLIRYPKDIDIAIEGPDSAMEKAAHDLFAECKRFAEAHHGRIMACGKHAPAEYDKGFKTHGEKAAHDQLSITLLINLTPDEIKAWLQRHAAQVHPLDRINMQHTFWAEQSGQNEFCQELNALYQNAFLRGPGADRAFWERMKSLLTVTPKSIPILLSLDIRLAAPESLLAPATYETMDNTGATLRMNLLHPLQEAVNKFTFLQTEQRLLGPKYFSAIFEFAIRYHQAKESLGLSDAAMAEVFRSYYVLTLPTKPAFYRPQNLGEPCYTLPELESLLGSPLSAFIQQYGTSYRHTRKEEAEDPIIHFPIFKKAYQLFGALHYFCGVKSMSPAQRNYLAHAYDYRANDQPSCDGEKVIGANYRKLLRPATRQEIQTMPPENLTQQVAAPLFSRIPGFLSSCRRQGEMGAEPSMPELLTALHAHIHSARRFAEHERSKERACSPN